MPYPGLPTVPFAVDGWCHTISIETLTGWAPRTPFPRLLNLWARDAVLLLGVGHQEARCAVNPVRGLLPPLVD